MTEERREKENKRLERLSKIMAKDYDTPLVNFT